MKTNYENPQDPIRIETPLTDQTVANLKAGDRVLLSGIVYTARDAAHKRLVETLSAGLPLPLPLDGQVIYYAGPAPARPRRSILDTLSIAPTTPINLPKEPMPVIPTVFSSGTRAVNGSAPSNGAPDKAESLPHLNDFEQALFLKTTELGTVIEPCGKIFEVLKFLQLSPLEGLSTEEAAALPVEATPEEAKAEEPKVEETTTATAETEEAKIEEPPAQGSATDAPGAEEVKAGEPKKAGPRPLPPGWFRATYRAEISPVSGCRTAAGTPSHNATLIAWR